MSVQNSSNSTENSVDSVTTTIEQHLDHDDYVQDSLHHSLDDNGDVNHDDNGQENEEDEVESMFQNLFLSNDDCDCDQQICTQNDGDNEDEEEEDIDENARNSDNANDDDCSISLVISASAQRNEQSTPPPPSPPPQQTKTNEQNNKRQRRKSQRKKLERENYLRLHRHRRRRGHELSSDDELDNSDHQDMDDDDDESTSFPLSYHLPKPEDEIEASKRYLETHQTPLYRWSMDMIPSEQLTMGKQLQQQTQQQSGPDTKKRRALFQQQRNPMLDVLANAYDDDSLSQDKEDAEDRSQPSDSAYLPCPTPESRAISPQVVHSRSARRRARRNVLQLSQKSQATNEMLDQPLAPIIFQDHQSWIKERMLHLVKAYSERGAFVKKVFDEINARNRQKEEEEAAAKAAEEEDSDDEPNDKSATSATEQDTERKHRLEYQQFENMFRDEWRNDDMVSGMKRFPDKPWWNIQNVRAIVYEPQSLTYIIWLMLLSWTFLYNAIIIPYRMVFPFPESRRRLFICLDIMADLTYSLDMLWFKPRLKFLRDGHWINDHQQTRKHYFSRKSLPFWLDLIGLIPIDWLIVVPPIHLDQHLNLPSVAILACRLNRLVKINDFWQFFERVDKIANSPYLFRIIHTLMYELFIIHLGACLYYRVSEWIGFGQTLWTYNNQGNAYLRCFYFAFRTTTSIGGRLPKPTTEFERIYMLTAWLLGVFVFAMVIGQIRDIVAHASRNQNYYIDALNKIAAHMNRLNVPGKLQKRVRFWYKFTWDLQKTFNEMEVIRMLPLKMRTDLMLSIHSQTLCRVDLFKNINRSVLRDLILKLQPILFLPGDYVCRKGDVGHEMYIVNKGTIQVVDSESRKVLAQLGAGSVFGEIAILNLHGQTKRTADVRSCGYSQLFALKKQDLWETLRYYPEYESILKRKVQRILQRKKQQQQQAAAQAAQQQSSRQRRQTTTEPSATDVDNIDDAKQQNDSHHQTATENDISGDDFTTDPITATTTTGVATSTTIQVESIVKDRPRTPRLFHAVMEILHSNHQHYYQQHLQHSNLRRRSLGTSGADQHFQHANIHKQKSLDHYCCQQQQQFLMNYP